MKWITSIQEPGHEDHGLVGGKGHALAMLAQNGFQVPDTLCVTSHAYREFIRTTGLAERIELELNRKIFEDMRWEEIWDCATRIRNIFLRKKLPHEIAEELNSAIQAAFSNRPVAVRSSATEEDSSFASFAGRHESYINIKGADQVLFHVQKVWASLWSDAALLYRREIGLNTEKSAMAVLIQTMVPAERSGVTFTQSPNNELQGVIESVHGLNQGLVDGKIEPDRWILDRRTGKIESHHSPARQYVMIPGLNGVELKPLPENLQKIPPLQTDDVNRVFNRSCRVEKLFGPPQDVEWSYTGKSLIILQARPITTRPDKKKGDNRAWYLSLHRSLENLKTLRNRIEKNLIPEMISTAETMAKLDPAELSDPELAEEVRHRWELNHKWVNIYWQEFIPFAHGVRIFGQAYNDAVKPEDPYEFVDLLTRTEMASMERNRMLEDLADDIRRNHSLARSLERKGRNAVDPGFLKKLEAFIQKYGDLTCAVTGGTECASGLEPLTRILLEMARHASPPPGLEKTTSKQHLKEAYLLAFPEDQRTRASEMLDLARTSYRLRDDDNIHLGRIEAQLLASISEARRRVETAESSGRKDPSLGELKKILSDLDHRSEPPNPYRQAVKTDIRVTARQITGQPAGPGLARGPARVIKKHEDLGDFKSGEVLVCDAVDPNMTFVVPLASAVVERRGGMLIHGAIIAREYGLPCVTGVSDVTALIKTGEPITVDGYLGIVTMGTGDL